MTQLDHIKRLPPRTTLWRCLTAALVAFAALPGSASSAVPAAKNVGVATPSKGAGAVRWDSLPLQYAIVTVRGTGRRKIAVLADPNCDYCQKFEEELSKLDDITVYVLPYPVVRPQSVRQVKAIWCSRDRAKAWEDFLLRRIEPPSTSPCNDPIDKIVAFGRAHAVDATPTWFLENGERYSGMRRHEELRRLLDRASNVTR